MMSETPSSFQWATLNLHINRLLYTSFKAPVCYVQDPYLIIMFWSWSCLLPWQSLSALPMASAERIDESDMILEKKKKNSFK